MPTAITCGNVSVVKDVVVVVRAFEISEESSRLHVTNNVSIQRKFITTWSHYFLLFRKIKMENKPGPSKGVKFGDPDYDATLMQWYEEDSCRSSDVDNVDEDFYMESEDTVPDLLSESETEEEFINNTKKQHEYLEEGLEEELEEELEEVFEEPRNSDTSKSSKNYYGKNRYKWSRQEPTRHVRTPSHNLIVHLPGLRQPAKIQEYNNPQKVWNLLFSDDMINRIVQWTNVKLRTMAEGYKRKDKPELKDVDYVEMKAFLGLLVFSSAFKSNHEHISALFATDGTGREIFRLVMSEKRFSVLLACLRFDNPEDRIMRALSNPAAAISELFTMFFQNCQSMYTVGENTTIDEMLIGFRGRCRFKMYMPQKPVKYGLKVMLLTDARSGFAYNGYIYTGKGSDSMGLNNEEKKTKNTYSVSNQACKTN